MVSKFVGVISALFIIIVLGCQKNISEIHLDSKTNLLVPALEQPVVIKESACPSDMVEIEGEHCLQAEEICLYNVDSYGKRLAGPANNDKACGEFKYPTKCLSKTNHMHFCIDKFEFGNVKGELPRDWLSWNDGKRICESLGKRLPTSTEWEFACEGPDLKPLPYGNGYVRDNTACNMDNHATGIDVFKATSPSSPMSQRLRSLLVPSGSKEGCVSDFQVYDQVGNVDEFVVNESGHPYKSALMGGHIWHIRARCRARTLAHNESFSWYETSFRCAKTL